MGCAVVTAEPEALGLPVDAGAVLLEPGQAQDEAIGPCGAYAECECLMMAARGDTQGALSVYKASGYLSAINHLELQRHLFWYTFYF